MKRMVVAVVGMLLLAGCGSSGKPSSTPSPTMTTYKPSSTPSPTMTTYKPSSTPSPAMTTYTDPTYRFSVTYDRNKFRPEAEVDPGIFYFDLNLNGESPGCVQIQAQKADAEGIARMLALWGKGKLAATPNSGNAWGLYVQGETSARWVTVNGIHGVRLDAAGSNPETVYHLAYGSYWYDMWASGLPERWTTVAPLLDAFTRSFRVVK